MVTINESGELLVSEFSGCCIPAILSLFLDHISKANLLELTASGSPHVFELWLGVCKGMLPVKYFYSNKSSFCVG